MLVCRVVGSAVSTIKDQQLKGFKLLVVREVTPQNNRLVGRGFLAVDAVGAGDGELVFVTTGSSARHAERINNQNIPCDATIVGILDSIDMGGKRSYRSSDS